MVLNKHGATLYQGVSKLVAEHLETLAATDIIPTFPTSTADTTMQSTEEELLLKAIKKVWDDHSSSMFRLGQILKYMDRIYVPNAHVSPTDQLGRELFLKHIVKSPIKEHVISAILNQVQRERDHSSINRSAVKGCVDIFVRLEPDNSGIPVYKRDLEPALLAETEKFYKREGELLVNSCDAPEFLRLAEERLDDEYRRANHYLFSQTGIELRNILVRCLLSPHIAAVIAKEQSGLDSMIDNNKLDVLSRLYRLCMLIPTGMSCLRSALKASILRRGKEINDLSQSDETSEEADGKDSETPNKSDKVKAKPKVAASSVQVALDWVNNVLELKNKFDVVWRESFMSNREVEYTLNEAFGSFVNQNEKCSEFISLYIDDHLKKGSKKKSDTEVDLALDRTIVVFRFVAEKDVFERYYKSHLAKRLINARSVSDDAERGMLAKLKVECGIQFTRKMEGMFNDMRISSDLTRDYQNHLSGSGASVGLGLSVIVMTSNCWPNTHTEIPCTLPQELIRACSSFEQFYHSKHSGRRLTWQLGLGTVDMRARFKGGEYDLTVSTYAAIILLLFQNIEEGDILTYSEIKDATQLKEEDLKRHLQTLACAKYKVLKKHPSGREVNNGDSFSFNDAFTATMRKIKISTVSAKVESVQERKETKERIDEERRFQIDACVVRIMKARKHMTHNELVNDVVIQLTNKFQPEPVMIKRRIEQLIEVSLRLNLHHVYGGLYWC
ncbi:Cullin-domain-containing protein [Panaeolus papilionaceus]|nr:Cullin-domain-containing protein [Panaeolus papilionaceus]